jgi:hypothetical protein
MKTIFKKFRQRSFCVSKLIYFLITLLITINSSNAIAQKEELANNDNFKTRIVDSVTILNEINISRDIQKKNL